MKRKKSLLFLYVLPMVHILVFYTGERPWNAANMMDKEFGIKAIAFIFSVSEESIEKILMKA